MQKNLKQLRIKQKFREIRWNWEKKQTKRTRHEIFTVLLLHRELNECENQKDIYLINQFSIQSIQTSHNLTNFLDNNL